MTHRVRSCFTAAAAFLAGGVTAAPLFAQQPAARVADTALVVDRIIAVVGSRAILLSHLEEQINVAFPGRRGLPESQEELTRLRRDVLDRLVNDELMVQEAERDTAIKVLAEEVTTSVDELMRNARSKYPSEEAYRRDLAVTGFQSPDEYRGWLSEQQRRRLQINRLKERLQGSGQMKKVSPTESEMREFFEKNKSRLPQRSATVAFRQIVIAPRPPPAAKERARLQADSIATELRKGGDFATAARRFSMDVASREQGGSINWVRRGEGLDPKFEEVAFSLPPGVISNPVESAFGFHLIQVQRAQPAEVNVRHILIMPDVDSVEADSARGLADQVYAALKAGASFDSLQRLYHDASEEKEAVPVTVDVIPPIYIQAIGDAQDGDLVPVFKLDAPGDPKRSKYALLLITSRLPAGDVRYQDVKEQIRRQLADELADQRYISRLRRNTFVDIRFSA